MNLNAHSGIARSLVGTHAFLSPSTPAWVNYEDDKLDRVFFANSAARLGSRLHAHAHEAINLKIKQADNGSTFSLYVNDGIGFGMQTEVLLFFSDNCYGHADTAVFRNNTLRIHDLKTGVNEASMIQLEIYNALFCLEYGMTPFKMKSELRIYQNDMVKVHEPDPDAIFHIMEKIKFFDKRINYLKEEEAS